MKNSNLMPFEGKEIRKIVHNGEWYFSIIDIIEVLTKSPNPRKYLSVLKVREPQLTTICSQLKLKAFDGRQRLTDCANTDGILRILLNVPSLRAEPLLMWLAEQPKQKQILDEINNPELLTQRQIELDKLKDVQKKG
jgi:DNA-damage-inducible protein D